MRKTVEMIWDDNGCIALRVADDSKDYNEFMRLDYNEMTKPQQCWVDNIFSMGLSIIETTKKEKESKENNKGDKNSENKSGHPYVGC